MLWRLVDLTKLYLKLSRDSKNTQRRDSGAILGARPIYFQNYLIVCTFVCFVRAVSP